MTNINRNIRNEILSCAKSYPVVTVIGPRQSGKTTLVRTVFTNKPYVNLEDPDIRSFVNADPRSFLDKYKDGAIIDEIQRLPELLSYIQVIVDNNDQPGLFILTGSHQLALQENISQSLAGRTGILQLLPFSMQELHQLPDNNELNLDQQILKGFYPRIYKHNIEPQRFYRDYVQTYLERDVKLLVNIKDLDQFQRFISLCATRIGQFIDYTQMANDLGISRHTIKQWISILKASFIIATLPPYFENLGKRITKTSKLYFIDVGLACFLLNISTVEQLEHHPLRGHIFENLIIIEMMKLMLNKGQLPRLYYYRDSNQLEVDLVFQSASYLTAIEIKSARTFHKNF